MRITSLSLHEELRLKDLRSYNILDSGTAQEFDELVELVTTIYGCPNAAITFVDQDRLWVKAGKNVPVKELPRHQTFCTHTIQEELMVVNDALLDNRFATNKVMTEDFGIRFYAGASITSSAGYNLGAVCVFDTQPRQLTTAQCSALRAVANQVSKLLELRVKNAALKARAAEQLEAEKEVTQSVLRQQEKQRFSISRELHENIAQGLAAVGLYLEMASQTVEHPFIASAGKTVNGLLKQVRDLTHAIVPTTLPDTPFQQLLQILADRYSQRYGLPVHLTYEGPATIDNALSFAAYRMVEEAVENVRRHAEAGNVLLKVNVGKDLRVMVIDDGIGINTQELRKGPGLNSIVAVTEYYGGTVDLTSDGKRGCSLTLQIPLTAAHSLTAISSPTRAA